MTPGDTLQDRPERATRTIRGLCTTETRTTPTSWVGQQSQCRAERSGKGEGGAPCYGPERRPRHGRQRAFAPRVVAPHAGDGHRTPSEGRGWRVSSPWDSGGGAERSPRLGARARRGGGAVFARRASWGGMTTRRPGAVSEKTQRTQPRPANPTSNTRAVHTDHRGGSRDAGRGDIFVNAAHQPASSQTLETPRRNPEESNS